MIDGPGPGGRYHHSMTLVGSKLFVFGGRTTKRRLNDIWALDLNSCTFAPRFPEPSCPYFSTVKSNPFWESYEPAPGNEKPLPRAGHVSVTTGDRVIVFVSAILSPSFIIMFCRFGGRGDRHDFNDTWSFNISTQKWTELQCTGSIPSPRASRATVLIDDVMYVFGGCTIDETSLGDLTVLNLSSKYFSRWSSCGRSHFTCIHYPAQLWTAFQDIGPSPCQRWGHAMASDGRRVFVLGGFSSLDTQADETKLIHVLDTSMYFLSAILFGRRSSLKQSSSTTQSPRVNHNTGYSLQMLERRTVRMTSHRYLRV